VASKRIDVDAGQAAEGAQWLERIESENADELTPERLAAMEAQAAASEQDGGVERVTLDEELSPVAGRRFSRA
jgi:(E)-4-hydroxy-3-methylbut-2-enyl-diphosphate synthase